MTREIFDKFVNEAKSEAGYEHAYFCSIGDFSKMPKMAFGGDMRVLVMMIDMMINRIETITDGVHKGDILKMLNEFALEQDGH